MYGIFLRFLEDFYHLPKTKDHRISVNFPILIIVTNYPPKGKTITDRPAAALGARAGRTFFLFPNVDGQRKMAVAYATAHLGLESIVFLAILPGQPQTSCDA